MLLGSAVAEELEIHLDYAQTARSSAWLLAETPLRPRFEPTPLEPSLLPPPAVGSAGCTGPPTLLLLLLWHIPYFTLSAPRLGVNTAGVGSSPAQDAEVLHGMPRSGASEENQGLEAGVTSSALFWRIFADVRVSRKGRGQAASPLCFSRAGERHEPLLPANNPQGCQQIPRAQGVCPGSVPLR